MLDHSDYRLGLGTYSLTGDDGRETIRAALEAGYRHVDTARLYENEEEVGAAIADADVDREDLFVATKVAHNDEPERTPEYVRRAVEESFERLDVETIDLLYHHWPPNFDDIETVLPILEEFVEDGRVERLGVSNYPIEWFERALELVEVPIYANEVEIHPFLQQTELHECLCEHDAYLVAYSPLAQGKVFEHPVLTNVAERHDTNAAAVSLAWLLSKDGVAAIPRSSSVEHLRANLTARSLELDEADLAAIDAIEETYRCEDPDWMEW